jgi:hypothetical protein
MSSSFAIPTNGRKLSKRKRVLEETDDASHIEEGPDDQPTSRDASGKNMLIITATLLVIKLIPNR